MNTVNELECAVAEFEKLPCRVFPSSDAKFNYILSQMHNLCYAISLAENAGAVKTDIIRRLQTIREIHGRSPFIKRLQTWPRGYQGDFQTIEYLCDNKIQAPADSIEYLLEWYALNSAIAQQHRNKVSIQSSKIHNLATAKKGAKVLVVGCGGGRDIRNIEKTIVNQEVHLCLNDMDAGAIEHIRESFSSATQKYMSFEVGNILSLVRKKSFHSLKFDLILFGGVLDYLPDKVVRILFNKMYHEMLRENGSIVFTNIKVNNPYRIWIEYMANWVLIERSREECMNLCVQSGIPTEMITTFTDQTGLTLITEVVYSSDNRRT
jgi:2-polyprenyl-3-methyl-5-hydroxy-6-metoxy-1,4-benzoquinol methylase